MSIVPLVLLLALIAPASAQTPSSSRVPTAEQDLAWLTRQLDLEAAARRRTQGSQSAVEFARLADWIGRPVRVVLKDGRSRTGIVEQANAQRASLRVRLGAGEYLMDLERGDVAQITER